MRSLNIVVRRITLTTTQDSFVVEKPPGCKGEVSEEAIGAKGQELFHLAIRILSIFPVKIHPLVPEGPDVGLQLVVVDNVKEVCWLTPLITSPPYFVFVSWSNQLGLANTNTRESDFVQSGPVRVGQVLVNQEDQFI